MRLLAVEQRDTEWLVAADIMQPPVFVLPEDHLRLATERMVSSGLREILVVDAQEKIVDIERRLFTELRTAIAGEAKRIRQTALALAEVDVLASFAHIAA